MADYGDEDRLIGDMLRVISRVDEGINMEDFHELGRKYTQDVVTSYMQDIEEHAPDPMVSTHGTSEIIRKRVVETGQRIRTGTVPEHKLGEISVLRTDNLGRAKIGEENLSHEGVKDREDWGWRGSWAVDFSQTLQRAYRDREVMDNYRAGLDHVNATISQAVAMAESPEHSGKERPDTEEFYLDLVREVQEEEEIDFLELMKEIRDETRGYISLVRQEGFRDTVKIKAMQYALKRLEEKVEESEAVMGGVRKAKNVKDKAQRFRRDIERRFRRGRRKDKIDLDFDFEDIEERLENREPGKQYYIARMPEEREV